ncbi:MAG: hypothetical protein ACRD2C_17640 [Acidimicrobiales bacterium]
MGAARTIRSDGPFHGERPPVHGQAGAQDRLIRRGLVDPATITNFTDDWRAALDEVSSIDGLRPRDLGYVGFSMGTMLGVPVCAGLDAVRAAVFGVGGVFGPNVLRFVDESDPARLAQEEEQFRVRGQMVVDSAARLAGVDVLQLAMAQDEVFSVDGTLELFAAFPGPKRIVAWEGGHTSLPHEALELSSWFLSRALNGLGADLTDTVGAF